MNIECLGYKKLKKFSQKITIDDIKRSMKFMQGKKLTDEQKIKMIKIFKPNK